MQTYRVLYQLVRIFHFSDFILVYVLMITFTVNKLSYSRQKFLDQKRTFFILYKKQDSKVSKGCAVLIELETLRNTKELSVFNDIFSL